MDLTPQTFFAARQRYLPILIRLEELFAQMDRAYTAVADQYDFQCNGCRNNCCLTLFYHHTLLEYLYIAEGMNALDSSLRPTIQKQAIRVNAQTHDADHQNGGIGIMCPLNQDGRCMTYRYRPMICRLHGIPHELHRPDGKVIKNPGCDAFFDQCRKTGRTDYIPFDRTPFYRQMALLEKELRQQTGYSAKIKLTIAQMIVTM